MKKLEIILITIILSLIISCQANANENNIKVFNAAITSYTVSGTVTDKATGLPLENMWAWYSNWTAGTWYDTFTDASGYFEFVDVVPGTVHIRVSPDSGSIYATMAAEFDLDSNAIGRQFPLVAGSTLSGKVIDAETKLPLSNMHVYYDSDPTYIFKSAYSDPAGNFTLTNLPPGIGGMTAIPDITTGYAWWLPWGSNWIYLQEGQTKTDFIIDLQKGALVSGLIKDPNGEIMGNVEFEFEGKSCEGWGNTEPNGFYSIRLPLGSHVIGPEEDGLGGIKPVVNVTDINQPIIVPDIIGYSPSTGSQITGTVINPGLDKNGVFEILAFEAGTVIGPNNFHNVWPVREIDINDAGPYTLTSLPPGNYDIYLTVYNETPDAIESLSIQDSQLNIPAGAPELLSPLVIIETDLTYSSEGSTLTGKVTDSFDQGILGATVLLNDSVTGDFAGFAMTDQNGDYSIYNLPDGTYTAAAIHAKYQDDSTAVSVSGPGTTVANTIIMTELGYLYVDAGASSCSATGTFSDPFKCIQGAINAAANGDTIIVRNGIYTGPNNRNLNFAGKAITLQSENGPDNCIINPQQQGRGFVFLSGENSNTIVDGSTVTGGVSSIGGGILCLTSSPTIQNCKIIGNMAAQFGGGMFNFNGAAPIVKNCVFKNNISFQLAGAICNFGSGSKFINCSISANMAAQMVGGMLNLQSNMSVTNSIFWGNADSTGINQNSQILSISSIAPFTYSCVQDSNPGDVTIYPGTGNIDDNPIFSDAVLHLFSASPCIDTGDPASIYSNEPSPNGSRINMGAYGNTTEATTTPAGP